MDYIREAEKYLWHYKDLQYSLNNINREISKLKWSGAPMDISSISYDGMPKGNYSNDEMINIAFKLKAYIDMKNDTEKEIKEIDEVLDKLQQDPGCENYKKLLTMWYVDKLPKEDIAEELNYESRTTIYKMQHDAIRKFAINLFGINAFNVV